MTEACAGAAAQPPPTKAAHCAERARPYVLAATILASAMSFIDGSVVIVALPIMQQEFGAGMAQLQWILTGYTLMMGSLVLTGGALGDRFGRRRMFDLGVVIFAFTSVACALAPNTETLIAARAAQGVGSALLTPGSLAIISASFPREIRGRAFGTWAGAAAITTAAGPLVRLQVLLRLPPRPLSLTLPSRFRESVGRRRVRSPPASTSGG